MTTSHFRAFLVAILIMVAFSLQENAFPESIGVKLKKSICSINVNYLKVYFYEETYDSSINRAVVQFLNTNCNGVPFQLDAYTVKKSHRTEREAVNEK